METLKAPRVEAAHANFLRNAHTIAAIGLGVLAFANAHAQDAVGKSTEKPVPHRTERAAAVEPPTINIMPAGDLGPIILPADLPDISNTNFDQFIGKLSPTSYGPSDFGNGVVSKKDEFLKIGTSPSGDWSNGIAVSRNRLHPARCVWLEPKILSDQKEYKLEADPCKEFWANSKFITKYTSDINCMPGSCVDGTPVNVINSASCKKWIYGNYAEDAYGPTNLTFPRTRGGFFTKDRPMVANEEVKWRYVSEDKKSVYARVNLVNGLGGWRYIDRRCLPDKLPHGNAAKKTGDTIPGARPNGG
jgi:hypothetical protein